MKLTQSALLVQRWKHPSAEIRVLRIRDEEFERTKRYAISRPLFDAVMTRLRFTPFEELSNLVDGLAEEVHRRYQER